MILAIGMGLKVVIGIVLALGAILAFFSYERHKFLKDLKIGQDVEAKHPIHDFFNAKITFIDGQTVRVIDKRGGGHIVNRKDIFPKI